MYKGNKKVAFTIDENVIGVFLIKDNILVKFNCFVVKSLANKWAKDFLNNCTILLD